MADAFKLVINQLVEEIEGLRISIGSLMKSAEINGKYNELLLGRFLEENGELIEEKSNGEKNYRVGPVHFGKLRQLDRQLKNSTVAQSLLPGSLFVTLVSRYDAFLGRLIRTMVLTCPDLLKSSERSLSLRNLLELGGFELARDYLIEKEIESVLRDSHSDHIAWLESKLEMPLRKDLPSWASFIELTERRNLLVHCDGVVSHQYVANCNKHSVPLTKCPVGDKLDVPFEYYHNACDCIIEIAVKLTHVVWRKLLPKDRALADDALTETCFELLIHENHSLAHELLRFAYVVLKKHSTERHRLIFLVNLAQACKWLGNDEECQSLLNKEDWSAKGLEFRLCVSVLQENFNESVKIMKQLGKNGFRPEHYREWPVFREARKQKVFQDGYENVFGEEMRLGESTPGLNRSSIKEILDSLMSEQVEKKSTGVPSGDFE